MGKGGLSTELDSSESGKNEQGKKLVKKLDAIVTLEGRGHNYRDCPDRP